MAELRRRGSVSQALLLELLRDELARWSEPAPDGSGHGLAGRGEVVDVGGGTGGVAAALATLGYRVRVVDPSPDALASLERRTEEAGVAGRVHGVQGDASDLRQIIGLAATDVVVCHRVLEVVDSPAEALAAMAAVLRPGGLLSLVVSQRPALVFSQALAGHVAQARQTHARHDLLDHDRVIDLLDGAGFTVLASHGIGAVADHVPESVLEPEPGAYEELWALEREIAADPAFRGLASLVHISARPPAGSVSEPT